MMKLFRVRLNCIDHYQATPTRYDPALRNDVRGSQVGKGPKVPVVRIFGSTETGQKVCAHVHGAFPYLFVEYEGGLGRDDVAAYMLRFHLSIDRALAVSYRRDQNGAGAQFVARITLVKGIPFYGFHVGCRFFLKIYMFNPIVMTRLADLLHQGIIMGQKFQPYEAHLQYLLQFMTDYNLYGCDYLDSSKTFFRAPVPAHDEGDNAVHLWNDVSIPRANVTDGPDLPRVSHCSIEVDICVQDILNRKMVKERQLHHDFVERLNPMPPELKLVSSMAGLWNDESKRRRKKMPDAKAKSIPFGDEILGSMSADVRDSQPQGWIHEEEYREQVERLIADEKLAAGEKPEPDFDTFVEANPYEATVKTALQSVTDLYPENLLPMLGLAQASQGVEDPTSSIEVDEKGILPAQPEDDDYFPEDSEEEMLLALENNADERKRGSVLVGPGPPGLDLDPSTFGVCASGMVTGLAPDIPLLPEFLEDARDDQFLSRNRSRDSAGETRPSKRPGSPLAQGAVAKRLKQDLPSAKLASSLRVSTRGQDQLPASSANGTTKKRAGKSPVSSQGQGKGQSNTLNFTVVKDQNNPSTRFHLSQCSQKQGSQKSEKSSGTSSNQVEVEPASPPGGPLDRRKHVSFGGVPDQELGSGLSKSAATSGRNEPQSPLKSQGSHQSQIVMGSQSLACSDESTLERVRRNTASQPGKRTLIISSLPPSATEVCATFGELGIPDVIYQDAFYSNEKDVPPRAREFAGKEFRLESNTLPYLPKFDPDAVAGMKDYSGINDSEGSRALTDAQRRRICTIRSWEIEQPPPSYKEVEDWWRRKQEKGAKKATSESRAQNASNIQSQSQSQDSSKRYISQIDGPTQKNKYGFKYSPRKKSSSVKHEAQYMSTMSLEVHVNTRGKFVPNPEEDEVQCVFWCVKADDADDAEEGEGSNPFVSGLVVLSGDGLVAERIRKQTSAEVHVLEETCELDVLVRMVAIVREHDPDILTGYEVHGSSWGYLMERARLKYDYDLCDEFSRMKSNSNGRMGKDKDPWGFNKTSSIRITGRHMINVWRAMRGEVNLLQYSMENVVWNVLHRRIPHFSWKVLTAWYGNGRPRDLAKVLTYYLTRTRLDIEILDANELVPRTSEQARLLGVDFFSVFSRGSQFKVESIMFRIAKPENYVLVSPSRKQVGSQNALECLPLVMEPQSAFYSSPVLVLDFQSLYPSVMIAYNYCYSTFLGRIVSWRGGNKMGFTEYARRERLLELLRQHINIAPNGMMYARPEMRKSLLARMLTEILETRVMVKDGMKRDRDDRRLQRLLNNRQLALKLLANVTYGYTSASFSGRMPCAEIADSIVQTGRETLERAIAHIHAEERWNAEVVYGDTDSLFIHLRGRTKDQAFAIGDEIARAVTDMNPKPVKLKFEKVYFPCVLLAKKRYVGYKYESPDQLVPDFDAKGIETVRRDGTPAEQKMEEKALKLLFDTADLSKVKAYFQAQCDKIMRGDVSIQDFCFAKEVRLGSYSDRGPPPPGALISAKRMLEDARAEPQYGERVPYVVISGAPGARLVDRCVAPEDVLRNPHVSLDAEYYISKNLVPPLERIFCLVGASVRRWYDDLPRVRRVRRVDPLDRGRARGTLEGYMSSASCGVCGRRTTRRANRATVPPLAGAGAGAGAGGRGGGRGGGGGASTSTTAPRPDADAPLCNACARDVPRSIATIQTRLAREERRLVEVERLCRSCMGVGPLEEVLCESRDCPVFYSRVKQGVRVRTERGVVGPLMERLVGGGGGGRGGGSGGGYGRLDW